MSRIYSEAWKDYELIDAGNNKKLERWRNVVTIRPERNAYFKPILPKDQWFSQAHFEFLEDENVWKVLNDANREWQISFDQIVLNLKLTRFKHLGVFPEQRLNWDLIQQELNEGDKFLNLFGYTAVASIVARSLGADVFHCDSVKQIIGWGKQNMESSGLADIHWVLEDVLKFAQREQKRGHKYKGIIMDPPAYGIGAKGERWKIENKIEELISLAKELTISNGFIILNTYSPKLQAEKILEMCHNYFNRSNVQVDTLCMKSTSGKVIEYGLRTKIRVV